LLTPTPYFSVAFFPIKELFRLGGFIFFFLVNALHPVFMRKKRIRPPKYDYSFCFRSFYLDSFFWGLFSSSSLVSVFRFFGSIFSTFFASFFFLTLPISSLVGFRLCFPYSNIFYSCFLCHFHPSLKYPF
jgi:hypothetical protein